MEKNTTAYRQFAERMRSGNGPIDATLARELFAEYPFFPLAAAMALKSDNNIDADTRRELSAIVALNAPDGDTLMYLADPDGDKLAEFYPVEESAATPSTDAAIDTFLDTYGNIDKHEQELLEKLIFNPVPDYSQVLVKESGENRSGPLSEQDAMLDSFLSIQAETHRHNRDENSAAAAERLHKRPQTVKTRSEAPLSESLARIYIKQQRFDKAYEIIHQLSLNYPKKSIYFADQLRFLRKLILNSKA